MDNLLLILALYVATLSSTLLLTLPLSQGDKDGDIFEKCKRPYSCGNLTNIVYPFYGNGKPPYCGHPGFELKCLKNMPFIDIGQQEFLVLNIISSPPLYTMTLARSDLLESNCSSKYDDTRIDPVLFRYTHDTTENITVHYGCQLMSGLNEDTPSYNYNYTCGVQDGITQYAFYEDKMHSPGAAWIRCHSSTAVPVVLNPLEEPAGGEAALTKALDRGFDVEYMVNWSQCILCHESSGYCGSDAHSGGGFSCICETGQYNPTCPVPRKPNIRAKLFLALTSAGVAVVFTCIMVCCVRAKSEKNRPYVNNWWRTGKNNCDIETFLKNHGPLALGRYRFSEVKKMTDGFKTKLGEGGYGSVYKGKLPCGTPVAVKFLNKSKGNGQDFVNEVVSIGRTSHVNVVTLLGFCLEGSKKALVYEYMSSGSLDKLIYTKPSDTNRELNWKHLHQIAIGIARGLEYLHRGCNTRILHFDIKPHNILLDDNFSPKISDFGLAKLCHQQESTISTLEARGTIGYIAPEVFNRNFGRPSYKSDVYSYGMMVLEMVGGRRNFQSEVSHSSERYFPDWIYKHLELGTDLGLDGVVTHEDDEIARKMIVVGLWCAQIIPSNRPSMPKVIEMLEGSLDSLQVPPKPSFSSPPRPTV